MSPCFSQPKMGLFKLFLWSEMVDLGRFGFPDFSGVGGWGGGVHVHETPGDFIFLWVIPMPD